MVLIFISLMINDVDHFFMCLGHLYNLLGKNVYSEPLLNFLIRVAWGFLFLFYFTLSYMCFFYIWILTPRWICDLQVFSPIP